jgi:hypothetical protein
MGFAVRAGGAVAAVAAALTLGACGSGSSDVAQDPASTAATSPPPSSAAPDGPDCTAVWTDGRMLPTSYHGCAASSGWVKAQIYHCSDGHRMVTYAHAFYAQPGHKITRSESTLAKDTAFRHTMAVCGA